MANSLEVEIIGLERLKNLPHLARDAFPPILRRAADNAQEVAAEGVGGVAAKSIMADVSDTSARVFSVMSPARTMNIELGRRRGERLVHTDALRRWARRTGFGGNLFSLAQGIRRRGVKGRFFMAAAHKSTLELLPSLVRSAGDEIRHRFGRL